MKILKPFFFLLVGEACRSIAEALMRSHSYCWNRAESLVDAVLNPELS